MQKKCKVHQKKLTKILVILLCIMAGCFAAGTSAFLFLKAHGKEQLYAAAQTAPSVETGELTQEEQNQEEWKEGRIRFQGELYDYNQDILTFLIMGIDARESKVVEKEDGIYGGQADTIFLLVLNPNTSKMQIIAIDRNTMADVDVYGERGAYVETLQTQIAVQHGYGDGTVKSAEYMKTAVSRLFSDLPIHGYCALNMNAISKVNDAVGGVTLGVMEDIVYGNTALRKGENVCLAGEEAYWYVRYRDTGAFGSSADRLLRQKQYMEAFVKAAKKQFQKDGTLPVTIFNALTEYMTTDITVDKAAYLASIAAGYSFEKEDMLSVPGETKMGSIYEEFYPDTAGLQKLIIEIFYKKTD